MTNDLAFTSEVAEKLGTYVYRLIDPRNGETFYVGKGQDNRVFAHIREQVDDADPSNKLRRIRDMHLAGPISQARLRQPDSLHVDVSRRHRGPRRPPQHRTAATRALVRPA